MSETRTSSNRHPDQTPLNPGCRLCHYAGYSNVCSFFQGGECPYISMRKILAGANNGH